MGDRFPGAAPFEETDQRDGEPGRHEQREGQKAFPVLPQRSTHIETGKERDRDRYQRRGAGRAQEKREGRMGGKSEYRKRRRERRRKVRRGGQRECDRDRSQ